MFHLLAEIPTKIKLSFFTANAMPSSFETKIWLLMQNDLVCHNDIVFVVKKTGSTEPPKWSLHELFLSLLRNIEQHLQKPALCSAIDKFEGRTNINSSLKKELVCSKLSCDFQILWNIN